MSSPSALSFTEGTKRRRSMRVLQPTSPIPASAIVDLVSTTLLHVPSAFNSQTTRITLLFGSAHRELWSLTASVLVENLGLARFEAERKSRIDAYGNSYGTALFWDDANADEKMERTVDEMYRDKVEEWMHQSNGMHQYHLWTALEAYGLGVNVQHYNPLIDAKVKEKWRTLEEWRLRAQMVFGTPAEGTEVEEKVQKLEMDE